MNFNVTFRCGLPIDLDKHPAGEELAEYLRAKFFEQGLNIQLVDNHEDFAWSLEFKQRSATPCILVGYVGDGPFEWLVVINSGVSWFGKLFGRSDRELREEVAKQLHVILSRDPHFSGIRWHKDDFADTGWTHTPTEDGERSQ